MHKNNNDSVQTADADEANAISERGVNGALDTDSIKIAYRRDIYARIAYTIYKSRIFMYKLRKGLVITRDRLISYN